MTKSLFFLISLFVCFGELCAQDLQFYREDLRFELSENYFTVEGDYNFCNNGEKDIERVLFYPFPMDSIYGAIDSVSANDGASNESSIIGNYTFEGFYFSVKLQAYGVSKCHIKYRQKLLDTKAEYILITTQKWNKPFESANYKLIVKQPIKIDSISYVPDSILSNTGNQVFLWKKKDFMPQTNMVIYFH